MGLIHQIILKLKYVLTKMKKFHMTVSLDEKENITFVDATIVMKNLRRSYEEKTLWLVKRGHVTWTIQSEGLKFVYDIGSCLFI